jgi:hypothetical protein
MAMSNRIAILTTLALCVLSAEASRAAVATGVVNDAAGNPVADATVLVYSAGARKGYSPFCPTCYVDCGKRTATDATGKFTLSGLDDQLLFNLLVLKEGYAPEWMRKVDPLSGPIAAVNIDVRPHVEDAQRALRGKIVDQTGAAVPYALVEPQGATVLRDGQLETYFGTSGSGDLLAVANDRGEFELAYGVPAKTLLLLVSARAKASRLLSANTGLDRKTIAVTDGATIRGRLLKDGKPQAGVELGLATVRREMGSSYPEERVSTDEKGRFLFTNVPPARVWDLYARMESLEGRGAMAPLQCATERDGQDVDVGDIRLQRGATLSGRVELTDGKPVPEGMRIVVSAPLGPDGQTIVLAPDGSFVFRGLMPGAYVVSPAVKGYRPLDGAFLEVLVKSGVNHHVIRLQPEGPD